MIQALINIFKVPELRNRILFTIGMLIIYRIGFWIPLPGVDTLAVAETASKNQGSESPAAQLALFVSTFTGGDLRYGTLFGLGILPYISAAIIFQLLGTAVPALEQLQKEGPAGRQKIQEYTRYTTVVLCVIQSIMYLNYYQAQNLVYSSYVGSLTFWACGIVGMTSGTVFIMWLGEQIDKYGIGNGASLIITAGILTGMPSAILWVINNTNFSIGEAASGKNSPIELLFLICSFIFVVAGSILITQGQRRIPVQQTKHVRGQKVYGGQRSYLPLRVNHGGVMPIIFASTLMMIPAMLFPQLAQATDWTFFKWLSDQFAMDSILYQLVYIAMIYLFAYFWTSVQFQPVEMATNLRDQGHFIPGLRPGPRTAEYLDNVMNRITYVGAGFLAIIAVIPTIIAGAMNIPFFVTSFLGGTGLLITVSVVLDLVQRIEANLLMRNYGGFLQSSESGPGKKSGGPRIRGPHG